ncbi:MAG TPA: hypothetical protein P5188_12905 [Flavobacterium sp.]|nr:hypothetical protein [Flavobacterium sp.]
MKLVAIIVLIMTFSFGYSQNKNIKEETKTTITTVDNGQGEKQTIKNENIKEVQLLEHQAPTSNTINVEQKDSPIIATKTTEIINPDGTIRTVDIDRSSYYLLDGVKYKVSSEPNGYSILNETNVATGNIYKTSTNSYIYSSKNKTSIGFFDSNGNLVLETYNPKTNKVTFETYILVKQ